MAGRIRKASDAAMNEQATVPRPTRSESPSPGQLATTTGGLRVAVAVNAKAGAARTWDREVIGRRIAEAVNAIGKLVEIRFVEPQAWRDELRALAARTDIDTVVVGGGDGSVSTAGSIFVGSGKAMGVIPLGTFNLFARSLRIPIDLESALDALSRSVVEPLDVGEMTDGGGRTYLFLHHVSLGFHPRFIETRDAMPYASRLGKMLASFRVWWRTVASLRWLSLSFSGDLDRVKSRYYQVAVTVGSFREGAFDFPHAEDLTKGDLDLVLMPARSRRDFLIAAALAAVGRWRTNPLLEVHALRRLVIGGTTGARPVSIDGEVTRRPLPLTIVVRPKALKVLHPAHEPPTSDPDA